MGTKAVKKSPNKLPAPEKVKVVEVSASAVEKAGKKLKALAPAKSTKKVLAKKALNALVKTFKVGTSVAGVLAIAIALNKVKEDRREAALEQLRQTAQGRLIARDMVYLLKIIASYAFSTYVGGHRSYLVYTPLAVLAGVTRIRDQAGILQNALRKGS